MSLKPVTGSLQLEWVKSSHSTPDGAACVEVAAASGAIHIRDSKTDRGPHLAVDPHGWAAFVSYATRT
ncbi:MAG TPA: DUF397 domain-containing protein [Streptomyces sp.]|jgi:hypothetical protein|nr:DUF397 domain-containing protein [Streptomyces sp.]